MMRVKKKIKKSGWVLGLKPETEPLVLGYGYDSGNGCLGQWEEVVG